MNAKQVRITTEHASRLQEIADVIPGKSLNALADQAVELWLEIEGPVYLAAYREAQQKVQKRRGVDGRPHLDRS